MLNVFSGKTSFLRPRIQHVYLDMDEVLSDFVEAACSLQGRDHEEIRAQQKGKWGIHEPLGITEQDLWQSIWNFPGGEEHFWDSLQPTPWFSEFIGIIHKLSVEYRFDWFIVSSPSIKAGSHLGKVWWLKRYFGQTFSSFCLLSEKWRLAKPGALLIDDYERNCQLFEEHGGESLMFPQHGNRFYRETGNIIKVKQVLVSRLKTPQE